LPVVSDPFPPQNRLTLAHSHLGMLKRATLQQ
jgi:hypothetical protein